MPNYQAPYVDWSVWRGHLGTVSDSELAEKIGCSRSAVLKMRRSLRIEAVKSPLSTHKWTDAEIAMLGTKGDEQVARKIGVNTVTVARKRRKLGIPPAFPEADNRQGGHDGERRAQESGQGRSESVTMRPAIPPDLATTPERTAYRRGWNDRASSQGKRAGSARSEAKAATSRANGALGGRPRKVKAPCPAPAPSAGPQSSTPPAPQARPG